MTDLDQPAAALAGCTVMQSITVFYPLNPRVPDLERRGRRTLRPRQVMIHAARTNRTPWTLNAPAVIGREILSTGALSSRVTTVKAVLDEPPWLTEVVASVEAALNGTTRHAPLTDELCGVVPTEAGTAAVLDYRAIRREQHPRGGEGT